MGGEEGGKREGELWGKIERQEGERWRANERDKSLDTGRKRASERANEKEIACGYT